MPSPLVPNLPALPTYDFMSISLPYSVEICIGVNRHVVVDHDVHMVYINSSAEDVSCHQYSLLELLELPVASQSKGSELVILPFLLV